MRQHAVLIEGLSFGYGAERIFEDFWFACEGPIAVLSGRNGCGKTTLLKILARVVSPDRAMTFRVTDTVRMVLQEDALLPWLTVEENLQLVRSDHRAAPPRDLVEPIGHLMRRTVFQLSFGQRRLVEMCRALENPPDLLCLDEPFNFLDASARRLLAGLIRSAATQGHQVVLSTHHAEDHTLLDAPIFQFPEGRPVTSLLLDR